MKQDYTNNAQLKFSNQDSWDKFLIDKKWRIDQKVTIKFTNFPYPCEADSMIDEKKGLWNEQSHPILCLPVHQCTENIHLRINNKDLKVTLCKYLTRSWNT